MSEKKKTAFDADDEANEPQAPSKVKGERKRPSVRVSARGRLSRIMDMLGEEYRRAFNDRDCRWVYAPTHKPELSNVLSRRAQGYQEVTVKELPSAQHLMNRASPDDVVRIGDSILMSIEAELRAIFKQELREAAMEQGERVQHEYYEKIEADDKDLRKDPSGRHRGAPRGSSRVEVKELEYEYEQRTGEPPEEG